MIKKIIDSCTKKNIQGKFISNLIDNRLPNSKNEELKQVKNSIIDGFCKSIKLSDMECSLCYRFVILKIKKYSL